MVTSMDYAASEHSESREYRWIFALTLPAFVVAVALERLTFWRRRAGTAARISLLSEARATAHTFIPFAFIR